MNLIVSVHFKKGFHEIFLPNINNNIVSFEINRDISGFLHDTQLNFEVWDSVWLLRASETLNIFMEGRRAAEACLRHGAVISCELRGEGKFSLLVNENINIYTKLIKYFFDGRITIGSDEGNMLRFNVNNLVSGRHAEIFTDIAGKCVVRDLGSRNGVFVNGRRISGISNLFYGDIVYIVGLKIVFLFEIIAVNSPEGIETARLRRFGGGSGVCETLLPSTENVYARAPRQLDIIDRETVEIETPRFADRIGANPPILYAGPLSFAAAACIAAVMYYTQNGRFENPGALFTSILFISAVTGAFWAWFNRIGTRRHEKKEAKILRQICEDYFSGIEKELAEKQARNRESMRSSYPPLAWAMRWVEPGNRRLWERNASHADFLAIRVGEGDIPSFNRIVIPKHQPFTPDIGFNARPEKIKAEYSVLKNAPILLPLKEYRIIGAVTDVREAAVELAGLISMQLALSHAFSCARMAFIVPRGEARYWKFAKWLPHVWNEDDDFRLFADDKISAAAVLQYLSEITQFRSDRKEDDPALHYVLFISERELADSVPAYNMLIAAAKRGEAGISLVLLYNRIEMLPEECRVILEKTGGISRLFSLDNDFKPINGIRFDMADARAIYDTARELSGFKPLDTASKGGMPADVRFMEALGVRDADSRDIYRRWLKNRTYESLSVPVGLKGMGKPFCLDIHEKYHGPHGIIAGTTGSGKSEFLQSYVLSVALNFHPLEVSFLFIDYKGGGMARNFENLPHTAGIVTNLDGNRASRALVSIKSEIERRQSAFKRCGVSHIDGYAELYRALKTEKPMPHLIIIADEFAELKKSNPDFITELISASRIGRSLGIHLILTTQTPSSAVDGEIRGNANFSVCFRVNDRYESVSMTGKPDAAYIKPVNIGRAYFQSGNSGVSEEFQTAWSGAAYEPAAGADLRRAAAMISPQGKPCILRTAYAGKNSHSDSEAAVLIEKIIKTAGEHGQPGAERIWRPPLPEKVYLSGIQTRAIPPETGFSLAAVIGVSDNPGRQEQNPAVIDLTQTGHILLCGPASSGKTTFTQTFLYALIHNYPPDRLHIYIADCASRILSIFAPAPHIGGIVYEEDSDKCERLIKLLTAWVKERRIKFSEKHVASYKDYSQGHNDIPAVLFVIEDFAKFLAVFPQTEDDLLALAKGAAGAGIYLMITCCALSEVKFKFQNYFRFGVGLQLQDKYAYKSVLGVMPELSAASGIPGRGVIRCPEPLEFQTALCVKADNPEGAAETLRGEFSLLAGKYRARAQRVPEIPVTFGYEEFMAGIADNSGKRLYLGYDLDDAEPLPVLFADIYRFTVGGGGKSGKSALMRSLIRQCKAMGCVTVIIDEPAEPLRELANGIHGGLYCAGAEDLFKLSREYLMPEFESRAGFVPDEKICVFIHSMSFFCDAIYGPECPFGGYYEAAFAKGCNRGVYFFACVSDDDLRRGLYSKAMKNYLTGNTGIYLGAGDYSKEICGIAPPPAERVKAVPPGVGRVNIRGLIKKVRIPFPC